MADKTKGLSVGLLPQPAYPLVILSFQSFLQCRVFAVIHVVDHPTAARPYKSDRVNDRLIHITSLWEGECCGSGGTTWPSEFLSYSKAAAKFAAVGTARFIVRLEREPIAKVRFVSRILFEKGCLTAKFVKKKRVQRRREPLLSGVNVSAIESLRMGAIEFIE